MRGQQLLFDEWANVCGITSAGAATLLGLLFVAIALAGERRLKYKTPHIRTYLTPARRRDPKLVVDSSYNRIVR
jgi:hypothetical protein